jgi:hypothetical protein
VGITVTVYEIASRRYDSMMRPVSERFIFFAFKDNPYGTDQDGA